MPTTVLQAPPLRIFRPCYGPVIIHLPGTVAAIFVPKIFEQVTSLLNSNIRWRHLPINRENKV